MSKYKSMQAVCAEANSVRPFFVRDRKGNRLKILRVEFNRDGGGYAVYQAEGRSEPEDLVFGNEDLWQLDQAEVIPVFFRGKPAPLDGVELLRQNQEKNRKRVERALKQRQEDNAKVIRSYKLKGPES